MNPNVLILAFFLLLAAVFGIAGNSIGIECYNKNESFKKDKSRNFDFLIANLVSNIVLILSASISMYIGITRN